MKGFKGGGKKGSAGVPAAFARGQATLPKLEPRSLSGTVPTAHRAASAPVATGPAKGGKGAPAKDSQEDWDAEADLQLIEELMASGGAEEAEFAEFAAAEEDPNWAENSGGVAWEGDSSSTQEPAAPKYGGVKRTWEGDYAGSKGGGKDGKYGKGEGKTKSSKGDYNNGGYSKGDYSKGGYSKGDDYSKGGGKGCGKMGQAAAKRVKGEKVYHGIVKSFDPGRSSGFIDCREVLQECQKETYVFQNILQSCCAGPGDTVAFFLHWSAKGLPQASHPMVRLKCYAEGSYALKGTFRMGTSGFGFIDCPETKDFFDRDVYVNKDLAAALEPGALVCFNVYLNQQGMPNAHDAAFCDESWEPEMRDLSQTEVVDTSFLAPQPRKGFDKGFGKGDGGFGKGDGKKGGGKSGTGKPSAPPTSTGQTVTGFVKSFNENNNYGFVESDDVKQQYGCDAFLHGNEFNGKLAVGSFVQFEVAVNSQGKPQATKVFPIDQGDDPTGAALQMAAEGGSDELNAALEMLGSEGTGAVIPPPKRLKSGMS
eukprot:TRINITY_DN12533_c0_g1_i1.p1 TRINITY_DN12533_c0_g1~~TRINITY_DN12533_c0_g1_i1.p1  ORF type:complete len:537 (-),score=143.73 TRINITY_DN12533_c0_g1_i1:59-1669(-)